MKTIGGVVLVFFGLMGFSMILGETAYTKTNGRISNISYDCYVKENRKKLKNKDDLFGVAYMDCNQAKREAKKHGFHHTAVKKRMHIEVSFTSPDNGEKTKAVYLEDSIINMKKYKIYQELPIRVLNGFDDTILLR